VAAAFAAGIVAVRKGERSEFSMEYPCHSPSAQRWFIGRVTRLAGKGPIRLVVAHENTTALKAAEEVLRESEDRYRSLVDTSMDAVLLTAPDGRVLAANKAACQMFGRSEPELVQVGRDGVVDKSDPRLKPALEERARTGRFCCELTLVKRDGTKFPGEVSSAIFVNRRGELRTSMVIRDISAGKRLEAALLQSEEKFRTIADFTCDWETWVVPDGRFIYASPSCERLTGYRAEEFMANPRLLARITHPEDRERTRMHFRQFTVAQVQQFVFRLITRGGEVRWVEHICQPVYGSGGGFVGRRASNRDITERKHSDAELAVSREQLRNLAVRIESAREEERTHIAHEIHDQLAQDLTRLKMDIAWLNRSMAGPSEAGQKPQSYERLASMRETVDSLLNSVQRIATGLRPVVLDSLGLCAALEWQARDFEMRTGIRCKTRLPEENPIISSECSTALFRILQEGLTNVARHAAATAVRITLESGDAQITMKIQDDGCGFRPESLAPHITYGLLGMRERAMALGGTCIIVSSPGKGTIVETRIPQPRGKHSENEEK
jgi:PAS domain S-box-containing protein